MTAEGRGRKGSNITQRKSLKNAPGTQLQAWLLCLGVKITGKKMQLVQR